jgi:hypothetical protein
MTGCYLTTLPFEFMRGQADFELAYASNYFLAQDIQPPERLRRRVWPDLDRWRAAHLELPEVIEKVEPNLAAGGFLELLDRLRDVFLQVSTTPLLLYYFFHSPLTEALANFYIALYRMPRCYGVNTRSTTYLKTLFLRLQNIDNSKRLWL